VNRMKTVTQLPIIDFANCVKCMNCVTACPRSAIVEPINTSCAKCVKYCISMEVPCSPENIIFDYALCDSCGECLSACPEGAIYWFTPSA